VMTPSILARFVGVASQVPPEPNPAAAHMAPLVYRTWRRKRQDIRTRVHKYIQFKPQAVSFEDTP
jgi:hypothetical protein